MEEGLPTGTEVTQLDETHKAYPSTVTTGSLDLTDHPAGQCPIC